MRTSCRKCILGEEPLDWHRTYASEVPAAVLQQQSLRAAIQRKIVLLQMQKAGIPIFVNYSDFLIHYQKVNQARQVALAQQQVQYGPPAYEEAVYWDYMFSNNLIQFKEQLFQQELRVTAAELTKSIPKQGQTTPETTARLEQELRNRKYEQWLQALIQQAPVRIDDSVLKAIGL